ncbi:gliding motility-associated C-terminal domain-containing protein [Psychroserpens sp. NJDZ02]|uniref:T9SS type B sorting domain-containing protein n=1 Tax=Psychroserpens sp. NJDZ02 TaxID=2570561 RepID=UPI0010A894D5|nr:gliding motility-associated C-terminal domain-containing protein [Psychroserpens sp. NJDZ02]QCE40912.1 T9SS type B sorting domain-containing protein [Psychroserpens sp. NJDZ02]
MKKTTFILAVLLLFIGWQANSQITTYPYTEDFEAGDGGWIADNTVAGTWALGLPADAVINSAASGANSWMTNLAGNYNTSENSSVTSPVFDLSSLTAPTVSFSIWWESEFSWDGTVFQSSIDNGVTWQNVGALGDPDNWYNDNTISGSPGGQSVGWTGRDGSGSDGWVTASHVLIGLAGETNVIFRFAFGSDTSGQDDGFAFDDVSIFNTSCASPSGLEANGITANSVDLSWIEGGVESVWEVVIQPIGTGVPVGAGAPAMTNAPYVDNTLTPATDYEFYVRADCGTEFSSWAGPVTFSTACAVFVPDYLEDFAAIPANCWDVASNGDVITGPEGIGASSWAADEFLNMGTGDGAYKINLYFNNVSDWILSPQIDLTGVPYQVEFDFGIREYGSSDTAGVLGSDDTIELLISIDNGVTWTVLETIDSSSVVPESGTHIVQNLSVYSGAIAQFAIRASDGIVNDPEDNDIFIDNFQVRAIPSCPEPIGLVIDAVTETSADISWNAGGVETEWNYVFQLAGTGAPTSGATVSTTAMSETGLDPATDYEVYVQSICTTGTSEWVGPFSFSTLLQFDFTLDCPTGGPQTLDYCYGDNDTNVFTFSSIDGTPLNLTINAGQVENNYDEVVILDSDGVTNLNTAYPYGSSGQLAGLTFQSTGDTISFAVTSDFSGSCQSNSTYTSINLTVTCATCINPAATYVVVDDCANGEQFLVDVDIASLGDATSVVIEDNQGTAPVSVSAIGVEQFGPYPFNTDVVFTVTNELDSSCVITSRPIALAACPPDNDDPCDATVAIVNNDEACVDVNSGTLLEATDSGLPGESCGTGVDDDVWFQFVATGEQHIIQIEYVGGFLSIDHAVYEQGADCNDLTQLYCTDEEFSLTPVLTVGNTYFIRIFSSGTTPTAINFDLCIQTLEAPTFCSEALPICADLAEPFSNVSDGSVSPVYIDYGCLSTQPNPLWNTINTDLAGDYSFTLEQTSLAGALIDVDFIVWGPFASQDGGCYELLPENIADCSYSSVSTETVELIDAPADSVYIILITNFDGDDGTYTFTQDSGPVNGINCDVVCEVALDYDGIAIEQGVSAPEGSSDTINLCGYDAVTLTATTAYAVDSIEWYVNDIYQDGENSSTLVATEPGTYQVIVGGGICNDFTLSLLTTINFYESATADQALDMESCEDASGHGEFDLESQTATILGAQSSSDFVVTYYSTLSDAQAGTAALTSPYVGVDGTTIYVRVEHVNAVGSNSGCASTNTSFNLILESCVFPQGISPNGDRVNDSFDLSNFDVQNIEIFNRNGRLVYSKANYTNEWEGQSDNGDMLPVGTYYYVVKYNGTEEKAAWVYINR